MENLEMSGRDSVPLWILCFAAVIICTPLVFDAVYYGTFAYDVDLALYKGLYDKLGFFLVITVELTAAALIAWLFSRTYKIKERGRLALLSALLVFPVSVLACLVIPLSVEGFFYIIAIVTGIIFLHYIYEYKTGYFATK